MYEPILTRAHQLARSFLDTTADRAVRPAATFNELTTALGGTLADDPEDASTVIERLATAADAGLLPTPGPRYFGFVIGGSTPVAVAADWLCAAWDQNAALHVMSPAVAAVE